MRIGLKRPEFKFQTVFRQLPKVQQSLEVVRRMSPAQAFFRAMLADMRVQRFTVPPAEQNQPRCVSKTWVRLNKNLLELSRWFKVGKKNPQTFLFEIYLAPNSSFPSQAKIVISCIPFFDGDLKKSENDLLAVPPMVLKDRNLILQVVESYLADYFGNGADDSAFQKGEENAWPRMTVSLELTNPSQAKKRFFKVLEVLEKFAQDKHVLMALAQAFDVHTQLQGALQNVEKLLKKKN